MAVAVTLNPDVSFIDCRIEYDVSYSAASNSTTVSAYFRVKSTGSVDSQGEARFKVYIENSSGTAVATATRTSNTTIQNDNTWRTYATATYTFTNGTGVNNTNSLTGIAQYRIGGGVSSGTDPLVGSSWNALPTEETDTITSNASLYPIVPSFTLQRTLVNLPSNTSSVSYLTSPSNEITTSSGYETTTNTTSGATISQEYAVSTSSTPGTYTPFSGTLSVSPLQRVWVRATATADGRTVDKDGISTANIVQTIYGYPSKPVSISLSKVGRQVTVTYGNSATNGGYDTSPTYTVQRSSNGGSTWEAHNNSDLLTPAATYLFRVYATNATGDSEARVSESLFLSAYGYMTPDGSTLTPVNMAKIYVGIGGPGADENGWRTVQNVKRYTESGWIDLQT
jgi:hypothetical protein